MEEMHHVVPCSDETKREREIMISWLRNTVALEQYIPLFLDCGYDSIRMVQEIEGRQDLIDMGIKKVGHQIFLLNAIEKIQDTDFNINTSARQGNLARVDGVASIHIDAMDGEEDEDSIHSLYVVKQPTRNTSIVTTGDANQIRSRTSSSSTIEVLEGVTDDTIAMVEMGYTHEGRNDIENEAVQKELCIDSIVTIQ
eukprot:703707_1